MDQNNDTCMLNCIDCVRGTQAQRTTATPAMCTVGGGVPYLTYSSQREFSTEENHLSSDSSKGSANSQKIKN